MNELSKAKQEKLGKRWCFPPKEDAVGWEGGSNSLAFKVGEFSLRFVDCFLAITEIQL